MARKRMISPGIWRDKKVLRLSNNGFILWIAFIANADDEGILEPDADAFYYEIARKEMSVKDVSAAIDEIIAQGLVVPYGGYAFIPTWYKHQTLNRPSRTKLRRPPRQIVERHPEYIAGWTDAFTTWHKDEAGTRVKTVPEYPYNEDSYVSDLQTHETTNDHEQFTDDSVHTHQQLTLNRIEENRIEENRIEENRNEMNSALPADVVSPPLHFNAQDQEEAPEESSPPDSEPAEDPTPLERKLDMKLAEALRNAFLSQQVGGVFTDPRLEERSIRGIVEKCRARAPDDPFTFAQGMLEAFRALKAGSPPFKPDTFWAGLPFTPSTLNSPKIWDRVLERAREAVREPDTSWIDQAMEDLKT